MKILLIDVNCKYSSTGKIVYDLYTRIKRDGDNAAIAYGRGPLIKEENIFKISSGWEVYLHAFLTRLTGLTGCFSHIATRRLLKLIDEFQPDVVHLHELHGYYVNIIPVIEYLKKKNIRTIWTFHCEFMYTGKCGHAFECEKWKNECGNCPHLKDYPKSFLLDFTNRMFFQKKRSLKNFKNLIIVSPSEWLKNRIELSFLRDKEVHIIHNGINTKEIFFPRLAENIKKELHIDNKKIVLAVAPNLSSEEKGGEWVLKLAKKMKNIIFVMIGVQDTEKIHAENVIALKGIYDQDCLAEYYSMADVFIICSKKENFPTTCVEALSCGTPIVGFQAGGTAETAPEGLGIFVPYGDLDALKVAVNQILETKGIKERCRHYGEKMYSIDRMYLEYRELYYSE